MDLLSREIDAAIRIFPKHQPLAHLQFQATEVYRNSAREFADSVYESGKLHSAREHYVSLKQIDPLSDHPSARLAVKNLVEWLNDVKSINRKANEDYLQAQSELREGRFRQTQKLANSILKTVADHEGAK